MAYLIAFAIFDTWGVASPPPPRPGNDKLRTQTILTLVVHPPVIASDMAGPQKDCTLRIIICVKLCCHTRLHNGTLALYSSMSIPWPRFGAFPGDVGGSLRTLAVAVFVPVIMKISYKHSVYYILRGLFDTG